jgi:hypothetical protein
MEAGGERLGLHENERNSAHDATSATVSCRVVKRVLGTSLSHRYSFDLSRDSLSRMTVSISDAFPRIRSHYSL